MKHKTLIKKLMGMGVSRNYANYYLSMMRAWTYVSNKDALEFYKLFGDKWSSKLGQLAGEVMAKVGE